MTYCRTTQRAAAHRTACGVVLLGALLTHATFADEPAALEKRNAVRAAEAHVRAQAQRREAAAEAARRLDAAKFEKVRQATLRGEVEREQLAPDAHAKTYLRPFRERLELETCYVERTCGLTDDQATELRKQSSAIAERAQAELAKALAARAGRGIVPQQAVVIVNGNAVAVPAGVSSEFLTNPAEAARDELRRATAGTLPEAARTRLNEADEHRHQRALAATRLAALVVLDEALLLSTPQREAIGGLLDSAWTVPVSSSRNPILAGPPHAAEMLHTARLVLPKAKLAVVLRPVQQLAFKSLGEPTAEIPPGSVPRVVRMVRPPAALRLNPVGRVGDQANIIRIQVNGRAGPQLVDAFPPVDVAARSARELDLMVDEVVAACELSDEQRTRLLLAGRLDLKRLAPRPQADAAQGGGVHNAAGQVNPVVRENRAEAGFIVQGDNVRLQADQVQILGAFEARKAFTGPSSAYQKTLRGKLSQEQWQRLAAAQHDRLVLHQRATVAAVLQALDERVLLSAEQHQHLSEFFEKHLAAEPEVGWADPQLEMIWRVSRVLPRDLQSMLDESQWAIALSFWQELCAAIPGR